MLQEIVRPTELTVSHLQALGVQVIPDSSVTDLLPETSHIPDFESWNGLSSDQAHDIDQSTKKRLNTGNLSPGVVTYLDRKRELSIANDAAYRSVRRVPVPRGQTQVRLGNSYEFYRNLELVSSFWDDTSKPTATKAATKTTEEGKEDGAVTTDGSNADGEKKDKSDDPADNYYFGRTGTGHQMPGEYRQNLLNAFLKLVVYDFGCNVSAPRTEPRLYLTSNPPPPSPSRSSYFSSNCTFIFRTPTTREAARSGVIEGPLVPVSARHTTSFPPPRPAPAIPTSSGTAPAADASDSLPSSTEVTTATGADRDSMLDLARELVAALITAQHRAREGKTEKRIGEGAWWTTKPRWGGGPGGPIGREVDARSGGDETIGDKDEPPPPRDPSQTAAPGAGAPTTGADAPAADNVALPRRVRPSQAQWAPAGPPSSGSGSSGKTTKRLKKSGNLPMYDNYRMIRPPSAAWDKKTKYEAIGRKKGVDYDDIFVVSSLFHHMSIVRIRVPDRLLEVLEGKQLQSPAAVDDEVTKASLWGGKLEVRRSKWFDFFKADERIEAMKLVWSMMAWLMRSEEEKGTEKEDVQMGNA